METNDEDSEEQAALKALAWQKLLDFIHALANLDEAEDYRRILREREKAKGKDQP